MDESMQRWADVPEAQRAFQTRLMEVYAGFLEHTDAQYGKVVAELEAQGLLENTLIIYINSDNGASAEGMKGTIAELLAKIPWPARWNSKLSCWSGTMGGWRPSVAPC
jgi:arylsulfatase A-like enzyme